MGRMRLYGEPGWGSLIVEAQLDWYRLDYAFERVGDEQIDGKAHLIATVPKFVNPPIN